jgi:stearoyl-CoA desaturase (delta-9 desaturase)
MTKDKNGPFHIIFLLKNKKSNPGLMMKELIISLCLFFLGYLINMFYISVLYHRGLTHSSILLGPKMMKWLGMTGGLLTGLDPKIWACMHRLHHQYSDTKDDPHSPTHQGIMGVWLGQYQAYLKIQKALLSKDPKTSAVVADIPFDVGFVNRHNLTWLPYLIHAALAVFLILGFDSIWAGAGYFLGIMGHPVQGWMVNALAHRYGSKNFVTSDDSRNNHLVALLVFGEGFQNNHHHYPSRAKFSVKWYEFDPGYMLCLAAESLGFLKINRNHSI